MIQTIMSHLVSNATLAQISERYDLVDRLRVPSHAAMTIKHGEKSKANVFESYIAGLYQLFKAESGPSSDGNGVERTDGQALDHVSQWLTPLFGPVAQYIRNELHTEQQRLSAPSDNANGEVEIDAAEAMGSSAMLKNIALGRSRLGCRYTSMKLLKGLCGGLLAGSSSEVVKNCKIQLGFSVGESS